MAESATAGATFVIDPDACSGHGRCYTLAPDHFEPDDNGYGIVTGNAGDLSSAEIDDVVAGCPEQAISVSTPSE